LSFNQKLNLKRIKKDFRQTLPIVRGGIERSSIEFSVKSSPLWQHFECLPLNQNMRVNLSNQEFSEFLLKVGNGLLPTIHNEFVEIPPQFISNEDLIEKVFDNLLDEEFDPKGSVILTTTNAEMYLINEKFFDMLPTASKTFKC
jgi:hypothetical protein